LKNAGLKQKQPTGDDHEDQQPNVVGSNLLFAAFHFVYSFLHVLLHVKANLRGEKYQQLEIIFVARYFGGYYRSDL
jgi:hypothetical protein